jgi:hypothetical protein
VIRKLSKRIAQGTAVVYFYFDFRDEKKQRVQTMLRTIILQLSAQSPHPYRALNKRYMLSKGLTLPNYDDLQHILKELLLELGRTYLVLDALDECKVTEHEQLLELIAMLRRWTCTPLHLLITSQPRTVFTDGLEDVLRVHLGFDVTQKDIKLFVDSKLRKMKVWASRVEEIVDRVVDKSSGM